MNNPFDLKKDDMVVVTGNNQYLGTVGKISKIHFDKNNPPVVNICYQGGKKVQLKIDSVEPLVRLPKPKPTFVPKFRKGDKIKNNEKCEYNQGTYTCHGDSFILGENEVVSVKEIYPVVHVDWFDKVEEKPAPTFEPKVKKGQKLYYKGCAYDKEKPNKDYVVESLSDSFIKDNREQFKGKIIKYSDTLCIGKEYHFYVDVFEPIVFEPTFKKDQKVTFYTTDNRKSWFTVLVLKDSDEIGRFKGQVIKTNNFIYWKVGDICDSFVVEKFELGEPPFEPKIKKGQQLYFIGDELGSKPDKNYIVEATSDSFMDGVNEFFKAKIIKNPSSYINGSDVNYYVKCFAPRIPTFQKGDKFLNGIFWYEADEDSWFSNGFEWVRGVDSVINHLAKDCKKIEIISDADGL